ncbi:FHA domain-containing protein [Corynebacterium felinum]|uniref:PSer/pThr/pTyr-binding forkhead associated (FHA) protein n=1 Tax=Corynebacterium felinum TaxID=131318 RepID=A0ABU2B6S6_9CORY|nr:FHA domain-containing protein [Corynebacterium felinum]MDF5819556.1 FHA domain-containing protein [Corynebacterium felinum]MDR7354316.1 pSer/pThr/pTyr-binding forkhead associated (FHA) protein [Corynebacterium felinum]WJY93693.1 FHA domain-containing protein FhaB [Corynebacterium felinum]
MENALLLGLRIGLLVLLWLFIFFCLNVLRRNVNGVVKQTTASTSIGGVPHQLAVIDGPLTGTRMDLAGLSEVTLGRAPDCTFVVSDDFASSRHARLFRRGNEWFVEDLDSRNGTYVQDLRIDSPERVLAGNDIKVGRTTVRLVG